MKIKYQAGDGYIGNRPIYVTVSDDEIQQCDSNAEAFSLVEDAIQDHFEQNVSPDYDYEELCRQVVAVREEA